MNARGKRWCVSIDDHHSTKDTIVPAPSPRARSARSLLSVLAASSAVLGGLLIAAPSASAATATPTATAAPTGTATPVTTPTATGTPTAGPTATATPTA
ncbi:hypothetical protein B0T42_08950, partial [Rathayibacter sp. VKM Ac-2630]